MKTLKLTFSSALAIERLTLYPDENRAEMNRIHKTTNVGTRVMTEWHEIQKTTLEAMLAYCAPCVTPISGALSDGTARHVGTGAYIQYQGHRLLVTNEHVASEQKHHSLACKFHDSDDYIRIANPLIAKPYPVDVAVTSVDDVLWDATQHSAHLYDVDPSYDHHAPVDGELLFMIGFAGERAHYSPSMNVLFTAATPYLTQDLSQLDSKSEFGRHIASEHWDPNYHFALHYQPELATPIDPNGRSLPLDAHGFSGSVVLNTRRLECREAGLDWNPSQARVTGIVWAWPTADRCLFATKIEHVLPVLDAHLAGSQT